MYLHIGHTFFGSGNFGDDLVLSGFLQAMAASAPGVRITASSAFDLKSQRRRFPEVEWMVDNQATREAAIVACDAWIGLGGSVLQESNDAWLLQDELAQLAACKRIGKPVFFLGCSVDERTDARRPEIRALLDAARHIWTRDAWSARALNRMGFDRATTAADLSHLFMSGIPPAPLQDCTGFICHFERDADYSIEGLADLIAGAADAPSAVAWLVQEARALPGSERDLYRRLPPEARLIAELRQPDYETASAPGLVGSWGQPARVFSCRYHGGIVAAWAGSRVVLFERQQKLRGLAEQLGIECLDKLPDWGRLQEAFALAKPVSADVLRSAAQRAKATCDALLAAMRDTKPLTPGSERHNGDTRLIDVSHQPVIERHDLSGVTPVDEDQIGPGLQRGDLFVVRGCLQAIGALDPLRKMILDILGDVAGPAARTRAEVEGLSRLHEFVPIDQLMRMNPLMKDRARTMAAGIVAGLVKQLPGLGPDVHFEDTPNVRIFIPHDVSVRHQAALESYTKHRGSAGELTLHPPHQDSRHFHPVGAINVWCAIDRVVEANGMSVFPTLYGNHLPFTVSDGGIRIDQHLGPLVTMDLAPGDAWIFETIHVHGSTINQTDETRFVISFRITGDMPRYRDKPWYNYVRPSDCSPEGPPPNPVDYSQPHPNRGRVTLDTSDNCPPLLPVSHMIAGDTVVASGLVMDGSIHPISDRLCIARIEGKPVAFARRCPHAGGDLAGAVIRQGQIVCPWHGLRIDPLSGKSACRTIDQLGLVSTTESEGSITIAPLPDAVDGFAPYVPFDRDFELLKAFDEAAERFHAALDNFTTEKGRWGLETLASARTAAAYALLAVPGEVIRARLQIPASRLMAAILKSGVRLLQRTAEEEAAFIECWRRLGMSWSDDAAFQYGLPVIVLSRHGLELLALQPLAQHLGWTELFWLQCLVETLPWAASFAEQATDTLPAPMKIVSERFAALPMATREEMLNAMDAAAGATANARHRIGRSSLQEEVAILRSHLEKANADLKEANAAREINHRDIQALTRDLIEANTDRAAIRGHAVIVAMRLVRSAVMRITRRPVSRTIARAKDPKPPR